MTEDAPGSHVPGLPRGCTGRRSEAWRLNREAMLLLGAGPRALLLQLAHPAVAAGVADHSDFRTDPWRRLAGTLRSYLTIVYGTTAAARAEIRRLNALHRGIVGPGYAARDPELSLWVHATLVDSTIAVYDAWLEPLPGRPPGAPTTRRRGRSAGRSACPRRSSRPTSRRSRRYVAAMLGPAGPVQSVAGRARARRRRAPAAARAAATLLPVPAAARPSCAASRPARTPGRCGRRSGCCRRPSARSTGWRGGPCERAVSAWLVAGWRGWRPLLPAGFRQMPKALAADRRVAGSGRVIPAASAIAGQ